MIFDRKGRFEIGLKFLNSETFGFLGMGVTRAVLNSFGICPVESDLLMMQTKIGRISSICFFNKDVGRGSNSQDFVGAARMYFLTSSGERVLNLLNLNKSWFSESNDGSETPVKLELIFSIFSLKNIANSSAKFSDRPGSGYDVGSLSFKIFLNVLNIAR